MKSDKIYLIGSMGSGKTTTGLELADRLRWDFIDMDEEIKKQEGMSISEIFAAKEEKGFRQIETDLIKRLLPRRAIVIPTGGGAFAQKENQALMRADGLIVWPYVPLEICLERIAKQGQADDRPLFKKLEILYNTRLPDYRGAHMVVSGVGTPEEIAENIIRERRQHF